MKMQEYIKAKSKMWLKKLLKITLWWNEYFVKNVPFLDLELIFTTSEYVDGNFLDKRC